ncbi:MAG: hypothetical protein F6K22_05370 [Okeania sp. SIO2F4]|nr:hypothetical protein [Okeania sp. SIO2F4]
MNKKIKLITERLIRRLLPKLMSYKRRPGLSGAGFVLPTVTMVMLVVLLLTIAISLRSFNRVEDARNVRVNQAVLSAATPALDRAKAKLEELLVTNPPTTGTPSEDTIEIALGCPKNISGECIDDPDLDKFTFGDETRLTVSYDIDDNGNIEDNEKTETAWRFEVDIDGDGNTDTDGDGTPDAYTIYGIFFKTPPGDDRARSPLEARVPPQSSENVNDNECPGVLATSKEWIPIDGKLKKSFFVYAVTVQDNKSGVSALEYQQDWSRTPLTNNAVVYEDDLEIAPGPEFNLNGRIFTNGNLIIAPASENQIKLHLVSSPASCFYSEADNSKMFVGGNLIYGLVARTDTGSGTVTIDLMNGTSTAVNTQTLDANNDSVENIAQEAAYNSAAYKERLDALVIAANGLTDNQLPQEVQDKIRDGDDREDALETYFRKLTRKVPNAETACIIDVENDSSCIGIDDTGNDLRPADSLQNILVLPDDGTTGVTIEEDMLEETPGLDEDSTEQLLLGDRIEVGNNLPQESWNGSELTAATMERGRERKSQVETLADVGSTDRDGFWEESAAEAPENSSEGIGGLRVITGAGIYATETGAYDRTRSFLPPPPAPPNMASLGVDYQVVWPDTMPMSPVDGSQIYDNNTNQWRSYVSPADSGLKGDLQMRATVLYHYAFDTGENPKESNNNTLEPQEPIACISSYYDPSTAITAQNIAAGGRSDNGIVYPPPTSTLGTQRAELDIQSKLVFPDGRLVNEPLKVALEHFDEGGGAFTLADEAAIDAELCALDILDGTIAAGNSIITGLDEGDIREVSFLDARQVKALDIDDDTTEVDETFTVNALIDGIRGYLANDDDTGDVDESEVIFSTEQKLPLEERQPLEIRATQLNLNKLRRATLSQTVDEGPKEGDNEYLLPMSGIIYASRNDALPDRTDPDSTYDNLGISADDFQLDPSRRPNGFMLINGDRLARGTDGKSYNTLNSIVQEKGLLFVSNNPVYIQGDFNLHEVEEFTNLLEDDWDNFYERTKEQRDPNFGCRNGDPRTNCNGESWRAATVLADAITLLSDNWKTGYRNHGDFDLRNNGGNGIIGSDANPVTMRQKRQFNGFFANSYATNGLSSGATIDTDVVTDGLITGFTTVEYIDNDYRRRQNEQEESSYFNNFVTPVQRRINGFPEYVMEVCPKLPVSACNAGDWVLGEINPTTGALVGDLDATNTATRTTFSLFSSTASYTSGVLNPTINFATGNITATVPGTGVNTLASGTTAITPDAVQRFPRRIAFLRNQYGELELDAQNRPIPIGVVNNTTIQAFPYGRTAPPILPRNQNNALWFRTTDDPDLPSDPDEATYVANRPLFYLAYDEIDRDYSGNRLILPPATPTINEVSLINDEAYKYSFCTNAGISQDYYALNEDITMDTSSCPLTARNNIQAFRTELMGLDASLDEFVTSDDTDGAPTISDADGILAWDKNEDGIVVYQIPDGDLSEDTYTLEGDSNDIFVLKTPTLTSMTLASSVILDPQGVNPNNIFWVSDGDMDINPSNSLTTLAGNFLGTTGGSLNIGNDTKILGGRFLGFSAAPAAAAGSGIDIRAMTNQANPSLVPALQIHEPDDNAGAANLNGGNASQNTGWMVSAQETTFNLIVGSGDTPARAGQGNGGLQNFVRFQENWQNPNERATNISGSFIQLDRSKYATAPQQQIIRADRGEVASLFGYPLEYESGSSQGILGFQTPPARNWGFDVGLLSQPPDLFALKFTLPPTGDPDEYFREVGIDDDWIRGLLCSKEQNGNNAIERPEPGDDGYYCGDYE